jgi:two-component system, NtrC family, sensor histidine kinase KinB
VSMKEVLAGQVARYEFSTDIDGQARHFDARWERITYADAPALQWTAHDITDRRELDHWREELTDIVVHNLRNPLTWVKSGVGMIQILLPQEKGAIDPDVLLALDKATRGIDKVEQQIDVLLNIGRAEAGHELTGREPTPLGAVINEVVELLTPRAASRGIRLALDVPEALPLVLGNRNMISWTLQNLVENAIKFSPRGEIVQLTAETASGTRHTPRYTALAREHPGPNADRKATLNVVRIAVIDRGPGVPSHHRQRIFQKFYRAPRAEGAQGSGLGLYFCKLAVEAHGGRIRVENGTDGTGARFSFTLPVPCEPASDTR